MKYLIIFLLQFSLFATELVPMDIKAGKWKSSVKNVGKDMISAVLAQIPDGPEKEKMKKMMNAKLKEAQNKENTYCLTAEEIANPNGAMKKFSSDKNSKNCKMKVTKSTPKEYDFKMTCSQNNMTIVSTYNFDVKNPKLIVGTGHIPSPGAGIPEQKFSIKSKWLKETCH